MESCPAPHSSPPLPVPDWRLVAEPDMAELAPSLQLPSDCSVLRDRVLSLSLDTCHVTTRDNIRHVRRRTWSWGPRCRGTSC